MSYRWEFDDGVGEHYIIPINPNKMTALKAERPISTRVTTAVGGQVLLFEGRRPPAAWNFSGVLFTKDEYDQLDHWTYSKGRITITDHYRRVLTVVLQGFDPTAKRSIGVPWRHDYIVKGLLLDVDNTNATQGFGV